MQTRKVRKRSRLQRGGIGDYVKFQYTTREERGLWVEALYPYANAFFKALKELPWDSYTYDGAGDVILEGTPDEIEELSISRKNLKLIHRNRPISNQQTIDVSFGESDQFIYTTPIHVEGANTIPYSIFGGSACELWNKAYPDAGKLHDTTDPTADIDIQVNPLIVKAIHPKLRNQDIEVMLIKSEDQRPEWRPSRLARLTRRNRRRAEAIARAYSPYTAFGDHYTRWLFARTVELARKIARYIPANRFRVPKKEETSETSIADLTEAVGPFLVSRLYKNDHIKIQITTQIDIPQGGTYTDHCLEMIIYKTTDLEKPVTGTKILNGLYVQGIYNLIFSQIEGLKARLELIKKAKNAKNAGENVPELSHKLINHYGRLLYLGKLFKYSQIEKAKNILSYQSEYTIRSLMDYGSLFEPEEGREACPPPAGCSPEEYRKPFEELLEYRTEEKRRENAIWAERMTAARRAAAERRAASGRSANNEGDENEENTANEAPRGPPVLTPGARFLQMLGLKKSNTK